MAKGTTQGFFIMIKYRKKPFTWKCPRAWEGETIVILGNGPSLTKEDIDKCREVGRIIALNASFQLAPWADVLYAGDAHFWRWYRTANEFLGLRIGMAYDAKTGRFFHGWESMDPYHVCFMASTGETGLEKDQRGLRHGANSGHAAINLAVHFGAKRIILLGYDMQPVDGGHHWFGKQPVNIPDPPYERFMKPFDIMAKELKKAGIECINCTPGSALEAFEIKSIDDVL